MQWQPDSVRNVLRPQRKNQKTDERTDKRLKISVTLPMAFNRHCGSN